MSVSYNQLPINQTLLLPVEALEGRENTCRRHRCSCWSACSQARPRRLPPPRAQGARSGGKLGGKSAADAAAAGSNDLGRGAADLGSFLRYERHRCDDGLVGKDTTARRRTTHHFTAPSRWADFYGCVCALHPVPVTGDGVRMQGPLITQTSPDPDA